MVKEFGYEENMLEYLDKLAQTNDITCLPPEVQEKYELHDCYVYVDLTPELIQYWENFIINTMKMIREKEAKYAELKAAGKYDEADKLWWKMKKLKSRVIILRICVVILLNFINR